MTLAALGYVGYGLEASAYEGTFVAPTTLLPVTSFSFDDSNEYITPDQIRGSRDRSIALAGPYSTSGSIDLELIPNGIALLLKSALASNGLVQTTAGSGYYTHVFTPGNTSPTMTFEGSAGDNALIRRYGGIRVGSMEVMASFGEIVTSSFQLEGTTRTTIAAGSAYSSPYSNFSQVTPFHFDGAKIQRNNVDIGNVKSFTFGVNNNIDRIGTLRRTRSYKRTVLGMRDVSLSMTLDFQDSSDYDLFLAETEFSVKLDLEGTYITGTSGPKYSLVIDIPRVRYNMTSVPISGGGYIEQSVDCQILRPLNGNPILTLTLINNESSVPS